MSYYKHHIFFCTNQRTDGRASCQEHDAQELRDYLKKRVKEEGLTCLDGIRVNNAGCLGRCGQGPVMVIYPEETWYQYKNKEDIDDIFEQHIKNNRCLKRLSI